MATKKIAETVWRAPGPVSQAFVDATLKHPDDILILTGPVSSGKNGCLAAGVANIFAAQKPSADGVRRLKIAIVRATYSRLIAATVPSWLQWWPESVGRMVRGSSPLMYELKAPDAHLQVLFVAIDRPDEASRIMGADLSFAVIDEGREVGEEVIAALLTRCGRYPPLHDGSGGPAFRGLLLTSNKSDTRHWLYRYTVTDARAGFRWFDQPGGLDDGAENLSAMPGGRKWYEGLAARLPPDQVDVLVHNRWGFISEGRPVFSSFSAKAHVSPDVLAPMQREPLICGVDIGPTQNPAMVVLQFSPDGRVLVLGELYSDGTAAQAFGLACRQFVARYFPDNAVSGVYADPAALQRSGSDGTLPMEVFSLASNWKVRPSPLRSMEDRVEVGQSALGRMVNGRPAVAISPNCTALISGLASRYVFKEISTSFGKATSDKILKTHPEGDCVDAWQYALAGAGEYGIIRSARSLANSRRRGRGVVIADHDAGYQSLFVMEDDLRGRLHG